MSDVRNNEKNAGDRSDYIKAAILAGIASAGIGAYSRKLKMDEEREKAQDVESLASTIIVPIEKKNFMSGLPTPSELAASRGEEQKSLAAPDLKAVEGVPAPSVPSDDIEARKKAILGARRFDFFRKSASGPDKKDGDGKKPIDSGSADMEETPKIVTKEKIDGRVVLRDMKGKFVSPTDPVAVQEAEKDAFSMSDLVKPVIDPAGTFNDVVRGITKKPLEFTAGAIGSLYLASLISDAINKKRREKSKRDVEAAKEEYVKLLNSENEKSAAEDSSLWEGGGNAIGYTLFIPMALAAMVTKRILDKRRADEKKRKSMSDTYPDEPLILYKTSEDKEIEIGADTALMAIMVKQAMIEDAESAYAMEKTALVPGYIPNPRSGATPASGTTTGYTQKQIDDAVANAVKMLESGDYDKGALKLIKAYQTGDQGEINKAIDSFAGWRGWFGNTDIYKTPEFRAALAKNKRAQDYFIKNFATNKDWIDFKNKAIEDRVNKWGYGLGLDKDNFLLNIIKWLAANTGIGSILFNRNLRSQFEEAQKLPPSETENPTAGQHVVTDTSAGTNPNAAATPAANPAQSPTAPVAKGVDNPSVMQTVGQAVIGKLPVVGPLANMAWNMFRNNGVPSAGSGKAPAINIPYRNSPTLQDYENTPDVIKAKQKLQQQEKTKAINNYLNTPATGGKPKKVVV